MTALLICLAGALAGGLTLAAVAGFRAAVPTPNRTYMDPLPMSVRAVWPLVLFFSHYTSRFHSVDHLEKLQHALVRAGVSYRISAEQFAALRIVVALSVSVVVTTILAVTDSGSFLTSLGAAAFGYAIPGIKLNDHRKKRERSINKLLPTYLDFITMAVESGLSLSSALVQATTHGPRGALAAELERVNRDITAGASRLEALGACAERLDMREVSSVVSAIKQADRSGGSIGATLRIQAEQQRIDRFQRAEKLAMEAPVKLIFPLVAFIFPTTFVILGFPIAMKLLHHV